MANPSPGILVAGPSVAVKGTQFTRTDDATPRNSNAFWPLVELGPRSKHPFLIQFEVESTAPEETVLKFLVHGYDAEGNSVEFPGGLNFQPLPFIVGPEPRRITLAPKLPSELVELQLTFYMPTAFVDSVEIQNFRFVHDSKIWRFNGQSLESEPFPFEKSWSQVGSRLIVDSYYGTYWSDMPRGWSIDKVHPACWPIVDEILFGKMEFELFGRPRLNANKLQGDARRPGPRPLLSFSAGTDSTAALAVLPWHSAKFHTRRAYDYYFAPTGRRIDCPNFNAVDRSIASIGGTTVINSTFELIPLGAGFRHGGRDQLGYAATGILLADHFNAGALAFGSVLEQVFLQSGHHYTDIVAFETSSQNRYRKMLRHAGLEFTLPVGGCSEVATTAIVEASKYRGLAVSCPRVSPEGVECGVCFKCFRKQRLVGANPPDPLPEVYAVLAKYPLKSGTSVIYACQKSGWSDPSVEPYLAADLDYLGRYHGYAVEHLVPPGLQAVVRKGLETHGVLPMSKDDDLKLRHVGRIFWPETHTPYAANLADDESLPDEALFKTIEKAAPKTDMLSRLRRFGKTSAKPSS